MGSHILKISWEEYEPESVALKRLSNTFQACVGVPFLGTAIGNYSHVWSGLSSLQNRQQVASTDHIGGLSFIRLYAQAG